MFPLLQSTLDAFILKRMASGAATNKLTPIMTE